MSRVIDQAPLGFGLVSIGRFFVFDLSSTVFRRLVFPPMAHGNMLLRISTMPTAMIIPYQSLSQDILLAVLEEYISREGTDYGEYELTLAEKVQQLLPQIKSGEVLVVFDESSESVQLIPKSHYVEPG